MCFNVNRTLLDCDSLSRQSVVDQTVVSSAKGDACSNPAEENIFFIKYRLVDEINTLTNLLKYMYLLEITF